MSGYPAPAPMMAFPPPVRAPRDGRGTAALITGLVGLGPLPIALGVSAIRHRRRSYGLGSGMGLTGIILGSLQVGLYLLIGLVLLGTTASGNTERAELRAACADGDLQSCDDLYLAAPRYSDDEAFGSSCAGRQAVNAGGYCTDLGSGNVIPLGYGDDSTLDGLWDACNAGDLTSCDDLYALSPSSSAYLDFGASCGNRGNDARWCVNDPGDDARMDGLYQACAAGDWTSCDDLYEAARPGSGYQAFADTCGNRIEPGGQLWCEQVPGLDPNV